MDALRITTLVENTAAGKCLLGEHGLSFWIEYNGKRILFDSGQSGHVLRSNAVHLGIDLTTVDAIVLSHGHFDHTGGLADVLKIAKDTPIFAHPAAMTPKFSRHADSSVHEIGISQPTLEKLRDWDTLNLASGSIEVFPGFHLTGEIPRDTDFEDVGGAFFQDRHCYTPDPLRDDQAAYIDTPSGLIVILGCAHSGVINTLRHIQKLTKKRHINTVVGGMHLVNASPRRLENTITGLKKIAVKSLRPAHCTGFAATARIWHEFPDCTPCRVGTVIE